MTRKNILLALFAYTASSGAACAQANSGLPVQQDSAPAGATANPASATSANDIVVTAQRRSELLKDVPISVTALTPQLLANSGVATTRDLTLVTPGLRMDTTGTYVQPAIRGITTSLTSPSADANVATYLDGVYQQSTIGTIFELPDIRQIEVLKGPQGTLFGRNATGGAILISTLDPDLNTVTGRGSVSYATYNSANAGGFISFPIIADRLAASLTGYYDHVGAYNHDLLDGGKRHGVVDTYLIRGKIRFVPWEGANFVLSGTYDRRRDGQVLEDDNLNGNNAANRNPALPPVIIANQPYTFASDVNNYLMATFKTVSLRGDVRVGPGSVQTTTAYTDAPVYNQVDGDDSPRVTSVYRIPSFSKTFTQELVYSTDKFGIIRVSLGGFYYNNKAGFNPLNVNNFTQAIYTKDTSHSEAVFGEVTVDLTNRLSIIGGLRYSHERRTAAVALALGTSVKPPLNPLGDAAFNSTTPRASISYKLSHDANVYFTYSQGFKSGAFNTSGFQRSPVQPEKVTSYEAGFKSTPLPGISLNGAGFYYDYTNLQVASIQTVGATFVQTLQNAATARIYGAELSGTWRATQDLHFTAGGTWLHAKYLAFHSASVNIVNPDGLGGNLTVSRDISGNQMIRAPKISGDFTGTYGVNAGRGRVELSGTLFYSSRVYYDVLNRVSQAPYTTINAKLAWNPREGLEFSAFGKNLTNGTVISTTTITSTYDAVNYLPPRTFGVEAAITF